MTLMIISAASVCTTGDGSKGEQRRYAGLVGRGAAGHRPAFILQSNLNKTFNPRLCEPVAPKVRITEL